MLIWHRIKLSPRFTRLAIKSPVRDAASNCDSMNTGQYTRNKIQGLCIGMHFQPLPNARDISLSYLFRHATFPVLFGLIYLFCQYGDTWHCTRELAGSSSQCQHQHPTVGLQKQCWAKDWVYMCRYHHNSIKTYAIKNHSVKMRTADLYNHSFLVTSMGGVVRDGTDRWLRGTAHWGCEGMWTNYISKTWGWHLL